VNVPIIHKVLNSIPSTTGKNKLKEKKICQVLMAVSYNLSYPGGRYQEDQDSKPASTGKIVCETLSQKKRPKGLVLGVAQVVEHLPSKCETLEFKTQK
jgi:hypothetical protein